VLGIWKRRRGRARRVGAIYDTVNYALWPPPCSRLLAFVIASAAFRALSARGAVEATLLLITPRSVMMIGRVFDRPRIISPHLPGITEWLLDVPNLAAKRAIAPGAWAWAPSPPALKIILGIEQSYLGRS